MEKLIVLGTGHALTTRCYNTCFALERGGEYFLVDAGGGNGILARWRGRAWTASAFCHLFVTHCHTDHILGCHLGGAGCRCGHVQRRNGGGAPSLRP